MISETLLPNTLTETAALMVSQSLVQYGYSGSLGEGVYISMGRNNQIERPYPTVVVYIDNITYPVNYNTRYLSGSAFVVKQIGQCTLNIEVEQYAKDSPENDLLSTYAFGVFDFPKQNLESLSSGSLFIYSSGQPEITETINIDDNTWLQKCSVKLLATLT